jgi:hypothetical protein
MSNIIETIPGESDNLALHVQLCEQRYIQLINKFDVVDDRLEKIESMLGEIKTAVGTAKNDTYRTYLNWAGVLIVALLGAVIHLTTKT